MLPPRPNNIGKTRPITSITGEKLQMTVVDEVVVPHGPGKLIYFQQLKWAHHRRIEYRLTYYMLGVRPVRKGQWVFGQYSLMVPASKLTVLLRRARKKGWRGI